MKNILAGAGLLLAGFKLTPDVMIAYTFVPLNVLVACAIGSFCSFSFSDKVEPRRSMWMLFLTSWFMGAAFTALVNAGLIHWLELTMTDGLAAALGAVVSFITRFLLPWLVDVIKQGRWLTWIPILGRGDKQQ